MRSLNIDQLKALIAVVELGSFTSAAKRLSLTQPAVSLQVRELEARFGVQLIERLGKRAFATPAGHELIEIGRRIERELGEIDAAMRRHRDGFSGHVRLGTSTTTLSYLLAPALRRIRSANPHVQLSVSIGTTRELLGQVRDNLVDVAVVTLPVDDPLLVAVPILTEELIAILPTHPDNVPDRVDREFIPTQALILEHRAAVLKSMILDWLEATSCAPSATMELEHVEAIKGAVAAGLGMAIVPQLVLRGIVPGSGIVGRSLEPKLERTVGLVYRRDKPMTDALSATIESLSDQSSRALAPA